MEDAAVLIVGAGGLGAPVAHILQRAGVGSLTLVDPDRVEEENLHRQILYRDADIGRPKAEVAASRVGAQAQVMRLDEHNGPELVRRHACVVDGTDSFRMKFLLNDLCLEAGVPLVHAAAARFQGQVLLVRPGGPCLRCLLPEPPDADTDECGRTGIFGPAAGTVAALAAAEALRALQGASEPSQLLLVHLGTGRLDRTRLRALPGCRCAAATDALRAPA